MVCCCKIFLRSTTLRHVWVELSRQRSSWGTSLPTTTSVQSAANCFGVLTSCICTWATSGALSSYKFLTTLQRSLTYSQESRISLSSSAWSWSSKETSTAENGLTIEHGNVFWANDFNDRLALQQIRANSRPLTTTNLGFRCYLFAEEGFLTVDGSLDDQRGNHLQYT